MYGFNDVFDFTTSVLTLGLQGLLPKGLTLRLVQVRVWVLLEAWGAQEDSVVLPLKAEGAHQAGWMLGQDSYVSTGRLHLFWSGLVPPEEKGKVLELEPPCPRGHSSSKRCIIPSDQGVPSRSIHGGQFLTYGLPEDCMTRNCMQTPSSHRITYPLLGNTLFPRQRTGGQTQQSI